MKQTIYLLAMMPFWLMACQNAVADESTAKAVFKEAFFQQTVEGDTAQAIELYQKGLKKPDVSARLAATAWFQLGICYENQGKKEKALECYGKVTTKYPGETKLVAKVKKKLVGLMVVSKESGDSHEKCYVASLKSLPIHALPIHESFVTRQYIKEKLGPPQFEHPRGLFLNYGVKYGLRFDMDGDRVKTICFFKSFPGNIYILDDQGKFSKLPPLTKDLVVSKVGLLGVSLESHLAILKDLPVDYLDISDEKVTRKYIKEKFGPPQFEHPRGLFLNYGAKYGLRFDMDGDRVREICLFKTFRGDVLRYKFDACTILSPLQSEVISGEIILTKKEPIMGIVVDQKGKPIPEAMVVASCLFKGKKDRLGLSGVGAKVAQNGDFILAVPGNMFVVSLNCKHKHYATKRVEFPALLDPDYKKKMAGDLPIGEGVQFKDGKLEVVLDKGATLHGKIYYKLLNGKKKPLYNYQVGLVAKGSNRDAKAIVDASKGEFFFDGILETSEVGTPEKMTPVTWELSCKRFDAPSSEWMTVELTFEKGEQAVAEVVVDFIGKGTPKITVNKLPAGEITPKMKN